MGIKQELKPSFTIVTIILSGLLVLASITQIMNIMLHDEMYFRVKSLFYLAIFVLALVGVIMREIWGPYLVIAQFSLTVFNSFLML
ncbi:MAG: hypothetical protein ACTSYA_13640, partial [Candidatus Kariarchaeaceae archaeon]